MTYNDGNIYNGQWVNNQRFVKVTMTFKEEDKYERDFLNDLINGKGIMSYSNGDEYNGN